MQPREYLLRHINDGIQGSFYCQELSLCSGVSVPSENLTKSRYPLTRKPNTDVHTDTILQVTSRGSESLKPKLRPAPRVT